MQMKNIFVLVIMILCLTACKSNENKNETLTTEPHTTEHITTAKNQVSSHIYDWMEYSEIIQPGNDNVLNYDIDNDGENEQIVVCSKEPENVQEYPDTRLKVIDNGNIIWESEDLLLTWLQDDMEYYLVTIDGKNYIYEHYYYFRMGDLEYQYKLYEFTGDGTCVVADEGYCTMVYHGEIYDVEQMDYDYYADECIKFRRKQIEMMNSEQFILLYKDTAWEDIGGQTKVICSNDNNMIDGKEYHKNVVIKYLYDNEAEARESLRKYFEDCYIEVHS